MIGKALIEIPPKFLGEAPVNPEYKKQGDENPKLLKQVWAGVDGLSEDIVYYGQWMREKAFERIGDLYPKVDENGKPLSSHDPKGYTVITSIWARTVASPNPALSSKWGEAKWGEAVWGGEHVPLASTFILSSKKGKETWIKPYVNEDKKSYYFTVEKGAPPKSAKTGTKASRGANFLCLLTEVPITPEYIKEEGSNGRMGRKLMAIIAEGPKKQRLFMPPTPEMEKIEQRAAAYYIPEQELPNDPRNFWTLPYGLTNYGHLFTSRQLLALTTFSDLIMGNDEQKIPSVHEQVKNDAIENGWSTEKAVEYANAIAVYLAFAVDRLADYNSQLSTWKPSGEQQMHTFTRQALPMSWDFTDANVFAERSICWTNCVKYTAESLKNVPANIASKIEQKTAQEGLLNSHPKVVSTDPPYYDNISYADLSDFFYVWLRRSLKSIYPDIFSTLMVPKVPELVATPYRENRGKEGAEQFFLDGMTEAIRNIQQQQPKEYPVTIYYAFKQSETKGEGIASTGWATFLEAIIKAGLSINGTWPLRTEQGYRMISMGTNALASSVVLVCRKQPQDAQTITRKDFIQFLRRELPGAIKNLQHSNLAPVDMAQASIGPGMAIFSRYAKVMEADGSAMSVKTALQLINEALDEYLAEQEGEYDPDTRFAITWFEQFGMKEGDYGQAEQLANARNVSVQGVVQAGVLTAKAGKAQLIPRKEMPNDWDPQKDDRPTIWEATQHLIKAVYDNGSETQAAELLNKLGSTADAARDLAYRLYSVCEKHKWADEAMAYNALVIAWPSIVDRANQLKQAQPAEPVQQKLVEVP